MVKLDKSLEVMTRKEMEKLIFYKFERIDISRVSWALYNGLTFQDEERLMREYLEEQYTKNTFKIIFPTISDTTVKNVLDHLMRQPIV